MRSDRLIARRGAANVAAGLAVVVSSSLATAARAQQTTNDSAATKAANAGQNNEAARQKVAAHLLTLGVGLDWRKLTLADLQQIEKDLKATSDDPDAHARVIVAARLRELNIGLDWHRFTARQLAELYVTALGAAKSHGVPVDTLAPPAAPTAPVLDEPPAYDDNVASVVPPPPVYYEQPPVVYYNTPTPYLGWAYYPATYYIPSSYANHHHGTTCIFPPAPQPFQPGCNPRQDHFRQPYNYAATSGGTRGQYGRPAAMGSFVPNGRGGNIGSTPAPASRSMSSFTPRPIVPAVTRPVTMSVPTRTTFGSFGRIGNIGFMGGRR